MVFSLEEFGRRISEKREVADEDREIYRSLDENRSAVLVGDRLVPLIPLGEDDHLDVIEKEVARSEPPFWVGDSPDCQVTPSSVSHKDGQTLVKDQVDRGTCVCFAALACMEAILKSNGGGDLDLSEQFANWSFMKSQGKDQCEDGLKTTLAAKYLSAKGVCLEDLCPYEERAVVTLHCSRKPSMPARLGAIYGIKKYAMIDGLGLFGPSIGNTDYLECLLHRGFDIVFGTHVAWGVANPLGIHDVILDRFRNPRASRGGHAMLIVGYNREDAANPFFLVKNSWGDAYAHDGYMHLSYDYVRQYAKYGYIVFSVRNDMPV